MSDKVIHTDVLISGAGPSGLMTACLLALHKISFRIIDKKSRRDNFSGAMIIHARTMEILHQMGLSLRFLKEGVIARRINFQFNYRKYFSIDVADIGNGSSLFPYFFILEQSKTEMLLRAYLSELGHQVEDGTALMNFKQKNGTVTSFLKKPDGSTEQVNTRFLIGAEGTTSLVRRLLRIPFPGRTYPELLFVNDSEADVPSLQAEMLFLLTRKHTLGFFPLPGKRWRIDGAIGELARSKSRIGFELVDRYLNNDRNLNINLFNPTWFSVFRSHSRYAPAYKHHHCFLVGDAAHVHSPVGAQGMNTGMQDAYNLAWKLAFHLKGVVHPGILDTYQYERLPVAKNIIRYTDKVYVWITHPGMVLKFLRLRIFPVMLRFLIYSASNMKWVRNYFFHHISGIGISYKNSPLSAAGFAKSFTDRTPVPGDRLPSMQYFVGSDVFNLHEKVKYSCFTLLVFGLKELPAGVRAVLAPYNSIEIVIIPENAGTADIYALMARYGQAYYLIRPDMHIAWRSDFTDTRSLARYLRKIFIPVHALQEA